MTWGSKKIDSKWSRVVHWAEFAVNWQKPASPITGLNLQIDTHDNIQSEQ